VDDSGPWEKCACGGRGKIRKREQLQENVSEGGVRGRR